MNKPAAAAVAQALNAETIGNQQRTIRELESKLAIALNNLKHAQDSLVEEHARAELLAKRLHATCDVLDECEEYFDGKADADVYEGATHPNREMNILTSIREARS